jgi:hypothetical protein
VRGTCGFSTWVMPILSRGRRPGLIDPPDQPLPDLPVVTEDGIGLVVVSEDLVDGARPDPVAAERARHDQHGSPIVGAEVRVYAHGTTTPVPCTRTRAARPADAAARHDVARRDPRLPRQTGQAVDFVGDGARRDRAPVEANVVRGDRAEFATVFRASGSGDDTADWEATVQALYDLGGGTIRPLGTDSNPIVLDECDLLPHVYLDGVSWGASVIQQKAGARWALRETNAEGLPASTTVDDCRVSNVKFDQNGQVGAAFLAEGVKRSSNQNIQVVNAPNSGTWTYDDGSGSGTQTYRAAGIALKGVEGAQRRLLQLAARLLHQHEPSDHEARAGSPPTPRAPPMAWATWRTRRATGTSTARWSPATSATTQPPMTAPTGLSLRPRPSSRTGSGRPALSTSPATSRSTRSTTACTCRRPRTTRATSRAPTTARTGASGPGIRPTPTRSMTRSWAPTRTSTCPSRAATRGTTRRPTTGRGGSSARPGFC